MQPHRHARSFFRLVVTDPPTREAFLSAYELGRTPSGSSPRQVGIHKGVSMFETEEQARHLAVEQRRRHGYIAQVAIPENVRVERQGRREGHHNVYASADDLLRWVVRVVPVRLESPEGR